jgi:predicted XRE-type DNA-binding protein
MRRGSGNVFRDLGFPEDKAHTVALRSELMICIEKVMTRARLTRVAAAKRLGIAQPRLNALLQGKLDQFDLDALVTMAARAGLRVELEVVR